METINFIFKSFWHFIGVVILGGMILNFIIKVIAIIFEYTLGEGKISFED